MGEGKVGLRPKNNDIEFNVGHWQLAYEPNTGLVRELDSGKYLESGQLEQLRKDIRAESQRGGSIRLFQSDLFETFLRREGEDVAKGDAGSQLLEGFSPENNQLSQLLSTNVAFVQGYERQLKNLRKELSRVPKYAGQWREICDSIDVQLEVVHEKLVDLILSKKTDPKTMKTILAMFGQLGKIIGLLDKISKSDGTGIEADIVETFSFLRDKEDKSLSSSFLLFSNRLQKRLLTLTPRSIFLETSGKLLFGSLSYLKKLQEGCDGGARELIEQLINKIETEAENTGRGYAWRILPFIDFVKKFENLDLCVHLTGEKKLEFQRELLTAVLIGNGASIDAIFQRAVTSENIGRIDAGVKEIKGRVGEIRKALSKTTEGEKKVLSDIEKHLDLLSAKARTGQKALQEVFDELSSIESDANFLGPLALFHLIDPKSVFMAILRREAFGALTTSNKLLRKMAEEHLNICQDYYKTGGEFAKKAGELGQYTSLVVAEGLAPWRGVYESEEKKDLIKDVRKESRYRTTEYIEGPEATMNDDRYLNRQPLQIAYSRLRDDDSIRNWNFVFDMLNKQSDEEVKNLDTFEQLERLTRKRQRALGIMDEMISEAKANSKRVPELKDKKSIRERLEETIAKVEESVAAEGSMVSSLRTNFEGSNSAYLPRDQQLLEYLSLAEGKMGAARESLARARAAYQKGDEKEAFLKLRRAQAHLLQLVHSPCRRSLETLAAWREEFAEQGRAVVRLVVETGLMIASFNVGAFFSAVTKVVGRGTWFARLLGGAINVAISTAGPMVGMNAIYGDDLPGSAKEWGLAFASTGIAMGVMKLVGKAMRILKRSRLYAKACKELGETLKSKGLLSAKGMPILTEESSRLINLKFKELVVRYGFEWSVAENVAEYLSLAFLISPVNVTIQMAVNGEELNIEKILDHSLSGATLLHHARFLLCMKVGQALLKPIFKPVYAKVEQLNVRLALVKAEKLMDKGRKLAAEMDALRRIDPCAMAEKRWTELFGKMHELMGKRLKILAELPEGSYDNETLREAQRLFEAAKVFHEEYLKFTETRSQGGQVEATKRLTADSREQSPVSKPAADVATGKTERTARVVEPPVEVAIPLHDKPFALEIMPRVIERPDELAKDVELTADTIERIDMQVDRFLGRMEELWINVHGEDSFDHYSPSEATALMEIIEERLKAILRIKPDLITKLNLTDMRVTSIEWYKNFSTFQEMVLTFFNGFFVRYGCLGVFGSTEALRLKERAEYKDGFYLETRSGTFESYGGVDFALVWKSSGGEFHDVAVVGLVRTEEGYAIVKVQGGKHIADAGDEWGINAKDDQTLWAHAKTVLDEDPRRWLARRVLKRASDMNPGGDTYFVRGEAVGWLINAIRDPQDPSKELLYTSRDLSLGKIRELVKQRRRQIERELADLEKSEPPEADEDRRLKWRKDLWRLRDELKKCDRALKTMNVNYDRIAKALGFKPDGDDRSYFVLRGRVDGKDGHVEGHQGVAKSWGSGDRTEGPGKSATGGGIVKTAEHSARTFVGGGTAFMIFPWAVAAYRGLQRFLRGGEKSGNVPDVKPATVAATKPVESLAIKSAETSSADGLKTKLSAIWHDLSLSIHERAAKLCEAMVEYERVVQNKTHPSEVVVHVGGPGPNGINEIWPWLSAGAAVVVTETDETSNDLLRGNIEKARREEIILEKEYQRITILGPNQTLDRPVDIQQWIHPQGSNRSSSWTDDERKVNLNGLRLVQTDKREMIRPEGDDFKEVLRVGVDDENYFIGSLFLGLNNWLVVGVRDDFHADLGGSDTSKSLPPDKPNPPLLARPSLADRAKRFCTGDVVDGNQAELANRIVSEARREGFEGGDVVEAMSFLEDLWYKEVTEYIGGLARTASIKIDRSLTAAEAAIYVARELFHITVDTTRPIREQIDEMGKRILELVMERHGAQFEERDHALRNLVEDPYEDPPYRLRNREARRITTAFDILLYILDPPLSPGVYEKRQRQIEAGAEDGRYARLKQRFFDGPLDTEQIQQELITAINGGRFPEMAMMRVRALGAEEQRQVCVFVLENVLPNRRDVAQLFFRFGEFSDYSVLSDLRGQAKNRGDDFLEQLLSSLPSEPESYLYDEMPKFFKKIEWGYSIDAHGTPNFRDFLGIALDGVLRKGFKGFFAYGDPSWSAGPHGPFYILWNNKGSIFTYVVPSQQYKDMTLEVFNMAKQYGLLTEGEREEMSRKVVTYDELVSHDH